MRAGRWQDPHYREGGVMASSPRAIPVRIVARNLRSTVLPAAEVYPTQKGARPDREPFKIDSTPSTVAKTT